MKIQFNVTKYNLVDAINRTASDFQATLVKGVNTFDSIVADAKASEIINIYNDNDEVIATYEGYTIFKAGSLYSIDNVDVVSIELMNADIQSQINTIYASVENVEEVQSTHDTAINDLGTAVGELSESQATQDLAIEDLAEAVSELEP